MAKGIKTGGRVKGTPNKATAEIKSVAQQYGPAALKLLAELAGLEGEKAAESEMARIAAAKEILDRGYGKSAQAITGADGGPVEHVHRHQVIQDVERLIAEELGQPIETRH